MAGREVVDRAEAEALLANWRDEAVDFRVFCREQGLDGDAAHPAHRAEGAGPSPEIWTQRLGLVHPDGPIDSRTRSSSKLSRIPYAEHQRRLDQLVESEPERYQRNTDELVYDGPGPVPPGLEDPPAVPER